MVLNILIINIAFHGFIYADEYSSYMIIIPKSESVTKSYYQGTMLNASLAVDGIINTCSLATRESDNYDIDPWWEIELDRIYNVTQITLRFNDEVYRSMKFLRVYVSNDTPPTQKCNSSTDRVFETRPGGIYEWNCESGIVGKYLRIVEQKYWIFFCEVEIISDIALVNLALYRPLKHSLQYFPTSHRTNDGDPSSCTSLFGPGDKDYWISITLEGFFYITHVKLLYVNIYSQIHVFISNNEHNYEEHWCAMIKEAEDIKNKEIVMQYLECQKPKVVSIVTIKKRTENISRVFSICEIEIYSKYPPIVLPNETSSSCLQSEYKCVNGSCINKEWLCDGTIDCPNDDDEPLSCENKDKEMFKCKRKNKKIKMNLRCDGIAHCTDHSDEEDCFNISSNPMNATFKGVPGYYVCYDGWRLHYSMDMCNEYNLDHFRTLDIRHKYLKYLVLVNDHRHLYYLDNKKSITYILKPGLWCESKTFVNVECRAKKDRVYSCGKRHYEDPFFGLYVLKGHNAKFPAWPWTAQLINKYDLRKNCGGSIISDRWILTAADCLSKVGDLSSMNVITGSPTNMHGREFLEILRFVVHPKYHQDGYFNIAMVQLKFHLHFSVVTKPICLPEVELSWRTLMSFRHCVFAGFGWTDEGGSRSNWLKQARMNIIETDKCAKDMQSSFPDIKNYHEATNNILVYNGYNYLCAGEIPLIDGPNTCHGDFGGALICQSIFGIWSQVGISVYVEKLKPEKRDCTHSFFIRVDQHLGFIHQTMRGIY